MDLGACKRIVIFGGSFDPPHLGHVKLPRLVMETIDAQAVAYVPARQQPLKPHGPCASAKHRLAMLRCALALHDWSVILTDEINRDHPGPSYTVETLEKLHKRLSSRVQMRLLIGADQLQQFDQWKSWQRIVKLSRPVVMLRPPHTRQALLDGLPATLQPQLWADRLVALPQMDISSSQVRDGIQKGIDIRHLVNPSVAQYIHDHNLYRYDNT